MTSFTRIPLLGSKALGPELFQEIAEIVPEGCEYNQYTEGYDVSIRLHSDDPRLTRIAERFAAHGWHPWLDHDKEPGPKEYDVSMERQYDSTDWGAATLLEPAPTHYSEGLSRTDKGSVILDIEKLIPDADFAFSNSFTLIVSSRLKKTLDKSPATKHLLFRPTVIAHEAFPEWEILDWADVGPPYWELTSNLLLPPLAPTCKMFDQDGQPFTGDYSNGCYLKEGLYDVPELHFTTSAIATSEPFDAALTFEKFGIKPDDNDRRLVISKRFYQVCVDAGVEIQWRPVRIDPD